MSLKMSQNLTNVYNKSKMKIKVSLDISVKASLKRCVFGLFYSVSLMYRGRLFYICGPATAKARTPKVLHLVRGMIKRVSLLLRRE